MDWRWSIDYGPDPRVECLSLLCPHLGGPIRTIVFVLDPPVGRWPTPVSAPPVLSQRSPPQGELEFDQRAPGDPWPETDQTAGSADPAWE